MSDIKKTIDDNTAQLTAQGSPWELGETTINGIDYKYYPNAPKTMAELIDQGRNHEGDFLIYEGERWSYADFFAKADALAYQLTHKIHVKHGDRVAIAMRNYPEWMLAFTAIVYAGAVPVPLNSWGKQAEIEYGVSDSGAKVAFFDQQRYDYVADELKVLGLTAIIARPEKPITKDNSYDIDELIKQAEGKKPDSLAGQNPEDDALIMYTSGTTGNPKGAVSSHRNICQAIFNYEFAGICAAMSDPEPIGKMLERGFQPKVMLSVPLFHISGCHSVFLLSIRGGRPIVIMHKWDAKKALELIEKERITMITAVPTMLMDMLTSPYWEQFDTSSMFGFGAGGSAQPPHLSEMIYKKLPHSFPGTGYGMTETNAAGFSATGSAYAYKPKSCGIKTPIFDVKIVDENGNALPQGEHGEIWLKAPSVIKGYWNKPDATKESFHEGWAKTGDIGYLDDEGFLFITDRLKDMVIRGGENIASIEVESAAATHPAVKEIAVFGVPDDNLGEELAAAVVIKEGEQLTEDELRAHIATQLAKFKVPRYVFFEEALPRNATFKVLKKQLKEKYKDAGK